MLAMRKKFGWLLVAGALLLGRPSACAFSLIVWPSADWQDATIGYDTTDGVGNIGEEFRWNVPTLYYGFDSTFVNYFGSRGIAEVEKVMAILNALPQANAINLESFPLDTRRPNARAQALSLLDLKSYVLGLMVEAMGLAASPRYVFTLRDRVDAPCCNAWWVIRRNFDPYTYNVSSYINGQLWTYRDILCSCTPVQVAWPINEPVDPLAYGEPVSAMFTAPAYVSRFSVGQFYTGLTRDDMGGLKYIYRKLNQNYEAAALGVNGGSGPWGPPGTNGVNPNFISTALRYGVEKLNFVRCDFDSLFGEAFQPITNRYQEIVITNGTQIRQYVDRVVYLPDFIFVAADLASYTASTVAQAVGNATSNSFTLSFTGRGRGAPGGSFTWLQAGKNPNSVTSAAGPGTYTPISIVTLNNSGPIAYNVNGFFIAETNAIAYYNWGSFSTSTNILVYPDGASVEDMERMVLQSGTGGTVWGPPGYVPTGQGVLPGDPGTGGGG